MKDTVFIIAQYIIYPVAIMFDFELLKTVFLLLGARPTLGRRFGLQGINTIP